MLQREIENLGRLREIIDVFLEAGFSELLERTKLDQNLPLVNRLLKHRDREPSPVRLRKALEDLGPTFIKLGQMLAQRPDIVPQEYVEELEQLEDHVAPIDGQEALRIVEESLEKEKDDIFRYFETEPVASASIAQVHRAELLDGEQVAVKVMKPGVRDQVKTDLRILNFLVNQAEFASTYLKKRHIADIFDQFEDWTQNELDLRKEAKNAKKLKKNLENDDEARIPYIYDEYTSEDVLTAEFIEAVKIDNTEELKRREIDVQAVAENGINALLKMVLRDGFFHADPHPANVLVDPDARISYVDFGIVGSISPRKRRYLALMLLNAANLDAGGVVDSLTKIAYVEDSADLEAFEDEVEDILVEMEGASIQEHSFSRAFLDIVQAAARNGIVLPTQFVAAGKGFVQVEGVGLTIYPGFKPQQQLKKMVRRIVLKQNRPQEVARNFMMSLLENRELIEDAPQQLAELIDAAKGRGKGSQAGASLALGTRKIVGAILASALIVSGTALLGLSSDLVLRLIAAGELGIGLFLGLMLLR
ncbi:MAG: AarF/UbiB family protein [Candidatus Nanohaloarchaea archaeon]|nr:AarF/UbiB family protein [Candidatus Nanohaloarchaea archaeon]